MGAGYLLPKVVGMGRAFELLLLGDTIDASTAEHYGLVNLIAGTRLATELIQNDLNPEALARELLALLDPIRNRSMREQVHEVAGKLGERGASGRAAQAVLRFIHG